MPPDGINSSGIEDPMRPSTYLPGWPAVVCTSCLPGKETVSEQLQDQAFNTDAP